MLRKDIKTDLGTFNFPETGFWLMHAVAIAGIYLMGKSVMKNQILED